MDANQGVGAGEKEEQGYEGQAGEYQQYGSGEGSQGYQGEHSGYQEAYQTQYSGPGLSSSSLGAETSFQNASNITGHHYNTAQQYSQQEATHVTPAKPPQARSSGSASLGQQLQQQQQQQRSEEEQSLSLKVMRLYKPRMDESGMSLGMHSFETRCWTQGTSGQLLLPGSFGQIYIGQVFSCYVSVCNNGICPVVNNVSIRAELEVNNNKIELRDRREIEGITNPEQYKYGKCAAAIPGETIDFIVQQELTSVGMHTLRVSVQFDSAQVPSTRSIRKHYRFEVKKPLSFSASFKPLVNVMEKDPFDGETEEPIEKGAERLLGQVSIQNLTKSNLLLASLEMIPLQDGFQASQLVSTPHETAGSTLSVACPEPVLLTSGSTRNFVFLVERKKDRASDPLQRPPIQAGMQVARILSRWTTDFAEQGRLMSQPLMWKLNNEEEQPLFPRVDIVVPHPKSPLKVGECSAIVFQISNQTEREIEAELRIDTHQGSYRAGILFMGRTCASLGKLSAKQEETIVCQALPLSPGLHTLEGITVVDQLTQERYTPRDLPCVYVE